MTFLRANAPTWRDEFSFEEIVRDEQEQRQEEDHHAEADGRGRREPGTPQIVGRAKRRLLDLHALDAARRRRWRRALGRGPIDRVGGFLDLLDRALFAATRRLELIAQQPGTARHLFDDRKHLIAERVGDGSASGDDADEHDGCADHAWDSPPL